MKKSIELNKYKNLECEYSRTEIKGEGFGKRKIGMKIIVIRKYEYEEIEDKGFKWKKCINRIKEEGIIIKIVRRINKGYYDYWYKVEFKDGKSIYRSYVEII